MCYSIIGETAHEVIGIAMKTAADILMTAALPVLMCYSIVGETAHEVIGIAMFGLFILHHILNFDGQKLCSSASMTSVVL